MMVPIYPKLHFQGEREKEHSMINFLTNIFKKKHQCSSFKFTQILNMYDTEHLYMVHKLIIEMSQ